MPIQISKATATEYAFLLGKIPGSMEIHAPDELRLNIFNINLPGISLNQSEMPWQGKHTQIHLGGITFDALSVNFLVDSECKNWKILFNWLTFIADNFERASMYAYEYVTDGSILIYNNFGRIHTKIMFKNLWIQSIGDITFSIRDGETHIEGSATFMYDRYEIYTPGSIISEISYPEGGGSLIVRPSARTWLKIISSKQGNGDIIPLGTHSYLPGANKKYNFVPQAYNSVSDVVVDNVSNPQAISDGFYTFENIISEHTIDVIFDTENFVITSSISGPGNMNLVGTYVYPALDSQTYTFAPSANYRIDSVLIDGIENQQAAERGFFTFSSILSNHTLDVYFVCDCIPGNSIGYTSSWVHINDSQELTVLSPGACCEYTWEITEGWGSLINPSEYGRTITYVSPSANPNCEHNPTIVLKNNGNDMDTLKLSVGVTTADLIGYDITSAYGIKVGCFQEGTDPACPSGNYFCCLYDNYGCEDEYLGRHARASGGICPDLCFGHADLVDDRPSEAVTVGCCPKNLL